MTRSTIFVRILYVSDATPGGANAGQHADVHVDRNGPNAGVLTLGHYFALEPAVTSSLWAAKAASTSVFSRGPTLK